jgi:aminopeptidase N
VIHDAKLGAISNMPSTSTIKVDATRNETSFETSVKMSTYLVAFAISDFLHKYDHTKRGKEVRNE